MKKMLFFFFCWISFYAAFSQNNQKGDLYVGAYYSWINNYEEFMRPDGSLYNVRYIHCNFNMGYQFAKRWKAGMEIMLNNVKGEYAPPFYYTAGLHCDFDVLHSNRFNIFFRGGLSVSNLSNAGEGEPTQRTVLNRIIGISFEYRFLKNAWFNLGYYNHFPLNNIPYKWGVANPFLGFRYRFHQLKI